MYNHFATVLFLLEYSIIGLSSTYMRRLCLNTKKPRFARGNEPPQATLSPAPPTGQAQKKPLNRTSFEKC